ncbi:MAG: domain S-box [Acidobacteria bacterium]|nr:domain S-box [Acidobacteriota bacterium]
METGIASAEAVMTAQPIPELPDPETLLGGERRVLELIATGAPLAETLDALCRVIDEQSGLVSAVFVVSRDGALLSCGAGPHLPDVWREATQSFAVTPTAGACGKAIHERQPIVVPDVIASPLYAQWREAAAASGIASVWSTPFFSSDGRALGTFAVVDREPRPPDERDRALVERATHLACIAVERDHAEQSLRDSERLLRLVMDALPVGVLVVDRAGDIILANPASLRIWGERIRSGEERYARSKAWWHGTGEPVTRDGWASARALREGETSVNELVDIEAFDGVRKTIQNSAVPIADDEGRVTGAVIVNEDVSSRIEAERKLHESLDRLRGLTGNLMRAQDEERRRIAQLLHETTAQDLAALKMHLAALARAGTGLSDADRWILAESIDLTERSMTGIRTLSYVLHPPFLDEGGLLSALRWYAGGFSSRSGITVDLDLPEVFPRLPQDVETALFRVVQEALLNVHHHAESPTAAIHLRIDGPDLLLEIEDCGHGMAPQLVAQLTTDAGAPGVGIAGMRERLQQFGGRLDIASGAAGTRLTVRMPIEAPQ